MTVLRQHKTGHTIWELVTIAVLSFLALLGAYVLLVFAAYGGQPSRLVFDNWDAKSNYWNKIVMVVHYYPTNPEPRCGFSKFGYVDVLNPTNKAIAIMSETDLTLGDFPPFSKWPVLDIIKGTTNVEVVVPIPPRLRDNFFVVGKYYVP